MSSSSHSMQDHNAKINTLTINVWKAKFKTLYHLGSHTHTKKIILGHKLSTVCVGSAHQRLEMLLQEGKMI